MLTKEQIQFYKDNGFIKLDNIYTKDEVETMSAEYDKLFELKRNEKLEATWRGESMKAATSNIDVSVLSIHNLQFHSSVFTDAITNKKMLEAVSDVMGSPNVLLHHTKAHLKPPEKGAPFVMHQDYHYFPFKKHSMVAVFIHLDDTTPENGGLAVYPGSHKLGPVVDKAPLENTETHHYVDQEKYPLSGATPLYAKKGDVLIFSYLLIHGSYLNTSNKVRRMFLIQLMSAEDEPVSDLHKSYGQGLVLSGKNVNRDGNLANRFTEGDK